VSGVRLEAGVDGLCDEPRPGAPRKITDEQVEAVVVATLERAPADATHWSTRTMAEHAGVGKDTVARIWRARNLRPWRVDTFKLSNDPQFIDKVRDIVGLYLDPPEKALVLLRRGVHKNLQTLERDIRDWIRRWNDNPRPFTWTKTADEIRTTRRIS